MARKLATYKGYDTLNTYYSDSSLLSPDIFDISFFPNKLTVGKNLIKFRGNLNSLKIGAPIDAEILDSNGDPIYSEFIDYIDQDGSRVLSIYIYEDTAPGDATIIFVTEITKINDQQIPNTFQNQLNAKWTRTIPVNPLDLNTSTVIFDDLPKVTISENVGVQLNRTYTNGQFPIYNTGQVSFISQNNQPTVILTGGKFNGDMINGTLSVPTPSNPLPTSDINASSTSYTSTISKVLNDTTLQLDFPYEVFDTQSNFSHTFNSFDNSAFQIDYEATPQYTPTQNSESFALIQISDIEPATGDISRIKVYLNSAGTVGTFEQVNDILLPNTEIFIDSTSSLTPDKSLGIFETQSIIDTYWKGHSYQGKTEIAAPTLTWTTSSINNATAITGTLDLSDSNNVYTFQLKNQFSGIFVSQSMYTVTLDAQARRVSNNPILSIYASGSAFTFDSTDNLNQSLPKKLGKKIGQIESLGDLKRYDDISFEFNSDQSGTGVLIFVVESGLWQLSDIRTLTDAEYGYTPNYTRFRTEIPTKIKSGNQLSFKIEYYNRLGDKSNTVNFVRNLNFEGGNRYIDGGFSMLTGSLFVANTLSSGVEIAGLQNTGYIRSLGYEGFNQATGSSDGGFLLFSGSALPQQSATTYQGVGLEMVSDANNFFRYRTNPSILDVHTETFFLGNPSTQFISGSAGQLEISSSGYHILPNGDITASSFLMDGGTITNNVTILGSVTANEIRTPALINGSPSTTANASSSIDSNGFAKFVSASIGGTIIETDKFKSSTNLGAPDSGPSFELTSAGVISGSEAYIRRISNFGSGNEVVPLLDTRIGLVDGRNMGRQVVTVSQSFSRNAEFGFPNSSTNDYDVVAYYYFHLLPYENSLIIHGRQYTSCGGSLSTAQSIRGQTRFTFKTLSNSGSMSSNSLTVPTNYDNWTSMGSGATKVFLTSRGQTSGTNGLGITAQVFQGEDALIVDIPESHQSKLVQLTVEQSLAELGPGTPASNVNHALRLDNFGVIATRSLTAANIAQAQGDFPGFTI